MMQFREALLQISKQIVLPGEAFLTYCKLCDLCQNAYAEVRKIELFYKIDARLSVVSCIQQKRKKAEEELLSSYEKVADLLEETAYKKLIQAVSETILEGKTGASEKATPPTAPAQQKKGGVKQLQRRGTPQGRQAGNTQNHYAAHRKKRKTSFWKKMGQLFSRFSTSSSNRIAHAIVSAVYFGGLFLAYWLVASFGAPTWVKILLGVATVTTTAYMIGQPTWHFLIHDPQQIGFGLVLLVAHPLCRVFFGPGAAFLSVCALSVFLALIILFMVYAIVDDRNAAAGFYAVLVLLGTVSLALSLSFPLAMQWVIGVVASAVFLFVIFLIMQEDPIDAEYLIPALAALICLLVNVGFFFLFRGKYKIIFFWMAGSSTLLSGIHAFNCFDDVEPGFGAFSICNIVLALGSLVLPFIF